MSVKNYLRHENVFKKVQANSKILCMDGRTEQSYSQIAWTIYMKQSFLCILIVTQFKTNTLN